MTRSPLRRILLPLALVLLLSIVGAVVLRSAGLLNPQPPVEPRVENWVRPVEQIAYHGHVVLSDGTVVYNDSPGRLFAISPSGIDLWNLQVGWSGGLACGPDDSVYLANAAGELLSISKAGVLNWRRKVLHADTFGLMASTPYVDAQGDVCVEASGSVRCFAPDGTARPPLESEAAERYLDRIRGGTMLRAAPGSSLAAQTAQDVLRILDATGAELWHVQGAPRALAIDSADAVYFSTREGYLHARGRDGRRRWSVRNFATDICADCPDILYVFENGRLLVALDPRSGRRLWECKVPPAPGNVNPQLYGLRCNAGGVACFSNGRALFAVGP